MASSGNAPAIAGAMDDARSGLSKILETAQQALEAVAAGADVDADGLRDVLFFLEQISELSDQVTSSVESAFSLIEE